jgi:hypothetical protein
MVKYKDWCCFGQIIFCKTASGTTLRDMECFCKEYPEDCLYDEFIPDEVPDDDTISESDSVPDV